jgi:hypothetical protein
MGVGKKKQWNERCLKLEMGDMGLNEASRAYSVPKDTLKMHLEGKNYYAVEGKVIGSMSDLPLEVEEEIIIHALKLEECMFGLTPSDLRIKYQ